MLAPASELPPLALAEVVHLIDDDFQVRRLWLTCSAKNGSLPRLLVFSESPWEQSQLGHAPSIQPQFDYLQGRRQHQIRFVHGYALDGSTYPCHCVCPERGEDHSFQLVDSATRCIMAISGAESMKPLGVAHFYHAFSVNPDCEDGIFHTMTQFLHTLTQLPLCNSRTQPLGSETSTSPLQNPPLLLESWLQSGAIRLHSQTEYQLLGPIFLTSPPFKAISLVTSAWINSSPSCPHILPILRPCRPPSSNLEHLNALKLRLHRSLSLTLQVSRSLLRIPPTPLSSTLSPLPCIISSNTRRMALALLALIWIWQF